MFNSPCYGCRDRYIGCHANCKLYIDAKQEYEAKQEQVRNLKSTENDYMSYRIENHHKGVAQSRRRTSYTSYKQI